MSAAFPLTTDNVAPSGGIGRPLQLDGDRYVQMASGSEDRHPGRDPELLGLVGDDWLHDRGLVLDPRLRSDSVGWFRDSRETVQKSPKYSGSG